MKNKPQTPKGRHYRDERAIKALGKKVRLLLEAKNLSIEEAANPDIHPTQWARIEIGISNATISYIVRIAKKLGVPPSELLNF